MQQSLYNYLANAHGYNVTSNYIHQIVLTKNPTGAILKLEADEKQAKYLVNSILQTLEIVAKDVMPIETLLRPNPKHIFCSERFCSNYKTCPAIKGNLK